VLSVEIEPSDSGIIRRRGAAEFVEGSGRPTSSSWLNLVERWFKELTDRRLRRGTFCSVPALIEAIGTWVTHWNSNPKPFVWHAEADKIIKKVRRGRKTLSQVKAATDH
jgi:hypothetical protein